MSGLPAAPAIVHHGRACFNLAVLVSPHGVGDSYGLEEEDPWEKLRMCHSTRFSIGAHRFQSRFFVLGVVRSVANEIHQ